MIYPEPIVGALIVNSKNNVLLIQQAKWNDLYCIPGGHVEWKETIENALKREVKEEVGLDITIERLLGVQDNINSEHFHKRGKHFIFLDYLCRAEKDTVILDGREIQTFIWEDPHTAVKLPNIHQATRFTIEKFLASSCEF
jgi:nucleoside triphosphatase